jgi:Di-haem cytochrome c peroxidase
MGARPPERALSPPLARRGELVAPLPRPKSLQQVGTPVDATRAAIPPDNPQTPEKIALGMKLFFYGRLSADGTVACSTCHDPTRAFTEMSVLFHRENDSRKGSSISKIRLSPLEPLGLPRQPFCQAADTCRRFSSLSTRTSVHIASHHPRFRLVTN